MEKNGSSSKMDMYNIVLDTKTKKKSSTNNSSNSSNGKNSSSGNRKSSKTEFKKPVNYTKANVAETMQNFNKVKKIIDEESRKKKKSRKKKMNKKLKKFIIFLVVFFILVITLVTLSLTLPLFKLESVFMVNTDEYSADEIAKCISLDLNENIFIAMFRARKENLASSFPLIDDLKYRYSFPNKLGFEVIERTKRYYVYNKEDNSYYTLSVTGYILDTLKDTGNWKDEILVSGITFENNIVIGTKINEVDLKKLNNFEVFYDALVSNIDECKITRVTFENIYMKIYVNSSVEIIFRAYDDVEKYNFSLIKLILKDVQNQKGIIDMTKENPTFVKN
ncbi:MAG: FtsQ-type POTRA domain-containing protein [Clostridia bacterium]|nr:FtsQ-type POTRA domain-containing protein [Clostridia bacterium]